MAQAKKKASIKRTTTTPKKAATISENEQIIQAAVVVEERPAPVPPEPDDQSADDARPRVLPLVFGGLVAGAIGFGAAFLLKPPSAPVGVDNTVTEQLKMTMAAQNADLVAEISALNAQLAVLSQSVVDAATSKTVREMQARLEQSDRLGASQTTALGGLKDRISEIERRPAAVSGDATDGTAEYQNELTALRQQVTDELGRLAAAISTVEAAQNDAVTMAKTKSGALAFAAISRAVATGDIFTVEMAELTETGIEIPGVLQSSASTGVVTLADLRTQFPDAARAAISATTNLQVDAGTASKLGAFLKAQLGVRSLGPRAGDDADAILSRAEAALGAGDIASAIDEIQTLPTAGTALMANWVALARSRLTVVDALTELSAAMGK